MKKENTTKIVAAVDHDLFIDFKVACVKRSISMSAAMTMILKNLISENYDVLNKK